MRVLRVPLSVAKIAVAIQKATYKQSFFQGGEGGGGNRSDRHGRSGTIPGNVLFQRLHPMQSAFTAT